MVILGWVLILNMKCIVSYNDTLKNECISACATDCIQLCTAKSKFLFLHIAPGVSVITMERAISLVVLREIRVVCLTTLSRLVGRTAELVYYVVFHPYRSWVKHNTITDCTYDHHQRRLERIIIIIQSTLSSYRIRCEDQKASSELLWTIN